MSRYLVKDKYTYERIPQTDYTYRPDYLPHSWTQGFTLSHNYILPIFTTERTGEPLTATFSAAAPVELDGSAALLAALPASSGFTVRVTDGACDGASNPSDGESLAFRVTFFGKGGESFSSVGAAAPAANPHGLTFSTAKMNFTPVTARLETTGGAVTAEITPVAVWNTLGEWGGQAHYYTAAHATLTDRDTAMVLTVNGKGGFVTRDLPVFTGTP